jgi:DNA primase
LSPNIILAFDSDNAGRKAAMRSAGIALSLGMDVKIADLPEGKDPADLVLSNPEEWKNVLRKAKPVVEFQLETVMKEVDAKKLDGRKIPALLREKVFPFVVSLQGAMERAHFIKMIHERTGLSEESIREDLRNMPEEAVHNQTGQSTARSGTILPNVQANRLDVISRKLFGLLSYLERQKSTIDTGSTRASIERLLGDKRYHNLIQELEPFTDELLLEAELFFGTADTTSLTRHMDELLLNFEEDILRTDLASAMGELSKAEKSKIDDKAVHELMKRCQSLALRISEISKLRS